MIKRLFSALILIIFISPITWAAAVITNIDKTEIVAGETITLTITADENSEAPDLEPLKNLFRIVGMQENTELLIQNGKRTASRSWIIALTPITDAKGIVIPPLQVGKEKTKPITIKIIDTPKNLSLNGNDILKMELSLEKNSAYIQQQLVLTLRLYIDNGQVNRLSQLIQPTLQDIDVHPLGNRRYERQINGILYEIIEQQYVISPQKSGTLEIPSFALTAQVNQNNRIQNKTIASNKLTLEVKPKPANYPAGALWLPAKQLSLTEQWNTNTDKVLQGNTLTRTLTITADGLTSNQIGAIPSENIMGVRIYPETPKSQDNWAGLLPVGTRSQENVIIPIQTGDIVLPEIKLAWWNTETDKLDYAILPPHNLHIEANPIFNNTTTSTTVDPISQQPAIIKKIESPSLWIWQTFTAFFGLTTLIGFSLWLYSRKQPAIIKRDSPIINPKTLMDDIKRACQENDPQQARTALDNWVKQQPENLIELITRDIPLAEAVDELNKVLYSEIAASWQGDKLWQAIQTLPPAETIKTDTTVIPPLYPK